MNKKVVEHVLERSQGLCEVCQSNGGGNIELHHILGGNGRRTQQERIETVIALCYKHHRGNSGVHGKDGAELNTRLKVGLQEHYAKQGIDEDEIRRLMGGRLYG